VGTVKKSTDTIVLILADAGLSNVNAEFQEFTVNARRTPQRVFPAHGADQLANVFRNTRTTALAVTAFPPPEKPKAHAVPGYHRFRLDDNERGTPVARDSAQPRPKEAIGRGQSRLLYRTMQDAELVTKSDVLQLESRSRFEACQNNGDQQMNGANRKMEATT
jgi:hypothetical protein